MIEIVDIYDGAGKIKIKGEITDSYLYINNKPQIVSFFAEIGTVWRYLIGTSVTKKLIDENFQYENLVSSGILDDNKSLSDQFQHILKLLSNGQYKLSYSEFSYSTRLLDLQHNNNAKPFYDTYGWGFDIIFTQNFIDLTIVEQYKVKILKGERPISVVLKLQDSWNIFVIDGHHKLKAYKELKINPKVVIISKIDSNIIEKAQGLKIMENLGLDDKNILNTFIREKEMRYYENAFHRYYRKGLDEF